jgi:Icc-related predicted phosphoesterase
VVEVLPDNALLILGNVDIAHVWQRVAPLHLRSRDGETIELGGVTFGFVAGGCLKTPPEGSPWKSYDRRAEEYSASMALLSGVNVLCSHVPPDIGDLRFDVKANRREMYGQGLREFIDEEQPAIAVFGHIHNPRAREIQRGRTRCINVGHFRRTEIPFVFDTDDVQR